MGEKGLLMPSILGRLIMISLLKHLHQQLNIKALAKEKKAIPRMTKSLLLPFHSPK
jgi:hypothetical protein